MKFDEQALQQANGALDYDALTYGDPEDVAKGLQGHLAEEDLRAFQHYVSAVFDQLSFGEIDTEEAENRIFWELKDYFRSY